MIVLKKRIKFRFALQKYFRKKGLALHLQNISIHKKLFTGIYSHAGEIRDYNITKKEWVLDGATVLYGSASELHATLEYDFTKVSKQDINMVESFNSKLECMNFSNTILNIKKLYAAFGYETVFSRTDVVRVLNITASPASELIKKLLEARIIVPVRGKGKGKYVFATEMLL